MAETTTERRDLRDLAKRFALAADESRLRVLCVLFDEERACVSAIAARLRMSVAVVSHHLRALSRAGIAYPTREGRRTCYLLAPSPFVADLRDFICRNRARP